MKPVLVASLIRKQKNNRKKRGYIVSYFLSKFQYVTIRFDILNYQNHSAHVLCPPIPTTNSRKWFSLGNLYVTTIYMHVLCCISFICILLYLLLPYTMLIFKFDLLHPKTTMKLTISMIQVDVNNV